MVGKRVKFSLSEERSNPNGSKLNVKKPTSEEKRNNPNDRKSTVKKAIPKPPELIKSVIVNNSIVRKPCKINPSSKTEKVKISVVRNFEQALPKNKVVHKALGEVPISSTVEEGNSKQYNARYASPEFYSTLSLAKRMRQVAKEHVKLSDLRTSNNENDKKADVLRLSQSTLPFTKVAKKLDFPLDEQLYTDLVALDLYDKDKSDPPKHPRKVCSRKKSDKPDSCGPDCPYRSNMVYKFRAPSPEFRRLRPTSSVESLYTLRETMDEYKRWFFLDVQSKMRAPDIEWEKCELCKDKKPGDPGHINPDCMNCMLPSEFEDDEWSAELRAKVKPCFKGETTDTKQLCNLPKGSIDIHVIPEGLEPYFKDCSFRDLQRICAMPFQCDEDESNEPSSARSVTNQSYEPSSLRSETSDTFLRYEPISVKAWLSKSLSRNVRSEARAENSNGKSTRCSTKCQGTGTTSDKSPNSQETNYDNSSRNLPTKDLCSVHDSVMSHSGRQSAETDHSDWRPIKSGLSNISEKSQETEPNSNCRLDDTNKVGEGELIDPLSIASNSKYSANFQGTNINNEFRIHGSDGSDPISGSKHSAGFRETETKQFRTQDGGSHDLFSDARGTKYSANFQRTQYRTSDGAMSSRDDNGTVHSGSQKTSYSDNGTPSYNAYCGSQYSVESRGLNAVDDYRKYGADKYNSGSIYSHSDAKFSAKSQQTKAVGDYHGFGGGLINTNGINHNVARSFERADIRHPSHTDRPSIPAGYSHQSTSYGYDRHGYDRGGQTLKAHGNDQLSTAHDVPTDISEACSIGQTSRVCDYTEFSTGYERSDFPSNTSKTCSRGRIPGVLGNNEFSSKYEQRDIPANTSEICSRDRTSGISSNDEYSTAYERRKIPTNITKPMGDVPINACATYRQEQMSVVRDRDHISTAYEKSETRRYIPTNTCETHRQNHQMPVVPSNTYETNNRPHTSQVQGNNYNNRHMSDIHSNVQVSRSKHTSHSYLGQPTSDEVITQNYYDPGHVTNYDDLVFRYSEFSAPWYYGRSKAFTELLKSKSGYYGSSTSQQQHSTRQNPVSGIVRRHEAEEEDSDDYNGKEDLDDGH